MCDGGAFNRYLMQRLASRLAGISVSTTQEYGIAPDRVEAAVFAWLARQRLAGLPGDLPAVTGAREPVLPGEIIRYSDVALER